MKTINNNYVNNYKQKNKIQAANVGRTGTSFRISCDSEWRKCGFLFLRDVCVLNDSSCGLIILPFDTLSSDVVALFLGWMKLSS